MYALVLEDNKKMALTLQQRMKRKQVFRRMKAKIVQGRKRAMRRMPSAEKLKGRANKKARETLFLRFSKGRKKDQVSFQERERIEKMIDAKSGVVKRLAKKLLPQLKKDVLKRRVNQKNTNANV